MRIRTSSTDDEIETEDFTVIAHAGSHSLSGDAAVRFEQQGDGAVLVTVQYKPAGPFSATRHMMQFTIRPWTE